MFLSVVLRSYLKQWWDNPYNVWNITGLPFLKIVIRVSGMIYLHTSALKKLCGGWGGGYSSVD